MKIKFNDLKRLNLKFKSDFKFLFDKHLESQDFIKGDSIVEFEKKFENKLGTYFLGCSNGTDAITAALFALDIGFGDEVILPSMSWISTAEVISLSGAKPVFVDVNDSFLIDHRLIEEKITPKTKAIVVVHLYGNSCNMDAVVEIAKKYNLKIVEDCAQAHFTKYKNKYVGTFGDIGTFSFFPGKNLGALGDSGGISTKNKETFLKLKRFINHGSLKKHEHKIIGTNSRIDSIQASFLSIKLDKIDEFNSERIKIAQYYNESIKNAKIISKPSFDKNIYHTFHVYCIRVKNRTKFIDFLLKHEIETSIHYPVALPFLNPYKKLKKAFPKAFKFQSEIVSLPVFPYMKPEEMSYVVQKINSFS